MNQWGLVLLVLIFCSGCASTAMIDRSYVNRAAMDLRTKQTPTQGPILSGLGSIDQGNSGGSCSTCAH